MALVIEDGTGVAGAEAFADATAYDAWLLAYFNTTDASDTATKEAAIRRAVTFMNGMPWIGTKEYTLCWPRDDLDDYTAAEIPAEVIFAQHVYTRAELASAGVLSPDVTLQGGKILTQVDKIAWDVVSAPNTVAAKRPVVTMAMDAIKDLLTDDYGLSGGGTKTLLRA